MGKKSGKGVLLRALLAGGAILAALPALADETIETITVTAQKRSENILDVPINVTAISAEDLREGRIETPTDLMVEVPNLDVKTNIPGAQQIITIRGVGLDDFSSTNNSTVGIYVDDIYLASFAEEDFNFFDLDRIEVLKGPQATLYGRNATAGAINIVSAKPQFDDLAGNISGTYGNYQTFQGDGMINIPVTDNFALRFAGETIQQGRGYWFSRVLDTDLGRQDLYLGRLQALWDPTSSMSVLLKVEGEHSHSQIGVGKFFGTISTTPASCPDFSDPAHCVDIHGYTDTTSDPFEGDWNHKAPYDVDRWNATLHVTDDLGWATLTSVTGYIGFRRGFYIDADASPFTDSEFDQNDKVNQFSQEFRLDGETDTVKWLVGADYAWDRVETYSPGSLVDLLGVDTIITADQVTHYGALFGQVDWSFMPGLTLSSGVRLAYEDRHYEGGSSFFVSGTTIPVAAFDTFLSDGIVDRSVDFRESLDWKPTADTLVYATVARGTKSGGFFNGISTNNAALAPYSPETLTDYEAGVKSSAFGDTMLIDGSVFYYDYHDLQAQTFTNVGNVSLIKLGNIPKARIYGLDLGVTWLPVDGLSLRAGLGILHTWLGSFPFATAGGPVTEPSGNKLPDAPSTSFNGTARYEHVLFGPYVGALQFQATYQGDNFKEALNTPYLFTKANWLFDGRVSVTTDDKAWELAGWIKNMFNEAHVVQATDDGTGDGYRIFNAPRTYGVTLTYAFK